MFHFIFLKVKQKNTVSRNLCLYYPLNFSEAEFVGGGSRYMEVSLFIYFFYSTFKCNIAFVEFYYAILFVQVLIIIFQDGINERIVADLDSVVLLRPYNVRIDELIE